MYYIGLDIGGTKCAATLGKIKADKPEIIKKDYFLTLDGEPYKILERFSAFIEKVKSDYPLRGIGVSCGGPLDSKNGVVMRPPSLPKWDGVKVVEYFRNKFGIPTRLKNDADACAVAEWKYGAGKGSKNMAFLTFGTGFGAGLILDGKLYSGACDNAGEIGHVRLTDKGPEGYRKNGSCEGYCSGSGMVRLADIMKTRKSLKQSYDDFLSAAKGEVSAKTMAEYARRGNAFCKAVYKKSGRMLGRAVSILIDLLNLDTIVIGGIYMRAHDLLYPEAITVMKQECLLSSLEKVKILPAKLSENIGDVAALSVAKGDY